MARITVEDCLKKIDNQYDLVLLAKERTVQLNAGSPMLVEEENDKRTIISLREIGDGKIQIKDIEASAIKRLRKEPDELEVQEDTEEETNDEFENLYKGQVSKSGIAILPSKRTRRIPEVKKPSLADEALSELQAEQPEIKEENLETEEAPLELSEEAPATEKVPAAEETTAVTEEEATAVTEEEAPAATEEENKSE
jgi:DNA-directed RNA polymerase subunit omega